jgi:methionyl-tRNA formyltransferase
MTITIVSDAKSWMNEYLPAFVAEMQSAAHSVRWAHTVAEMAAMEPCDVAFYLSCEQLVPAAVLARNTHNIVVHASALPQGKGWSPMTWQILEGKNELPITLFEAVEAVDSGVIYLSEVIRFTGTELLDGLRAELGRTTVAMCMRFLEQYPSIIGTAREQQGESTFYPRRRAADSQLDLEKTLGEQFNLLRVVDNERYPAFFEVNGQRFIVKVYADETQGTKP